MDYNERFGQIQALLADLSCRMDQWDGHTGTIAGAPKTPDEQPIHPNDLELYAAAYETRVRRLEEAVFNKAS